MPDVVVNFATAGEANVVRAWAAASSAVKAHNQTLGEAYNAAMRADTSLRQLTSFGAKGIRSLGGEMKSLALGMIGGGGIIGALAMWKSANEEILKQAHDTTLVYDALFRKFNIQSGLRGLEAKEAQEKLLDLSGERAVPEEVAAQAATQLVSSGYAVKEVLQGGAANEFLQGMNAMNQRGAGVDPTSLAGAATSFMTAMGVNKDAAGMRSTMSSLFAAFQGTNIQLPDLQQYAAKAGGMKGKLTFQELIAAGSIHRDLGIESAESASGLEGLVGQAGTAGASKDKIAALRQIGLKPSDIDLIGEDFDTMLGRLQGGLASIPEEQREGVMKKVFEQAGVKFLKPLLEGRGTMRDRIAAMQSAEGSYAGAVAEAEQGPGAVAVRQAVEERRLLAKRDTGIAELRKELQHIGRLKGDAAGTTDAALSAFDASYYVSGDEDQAARSFANISNAEWSDYTEAKKRLKAKGMSLPTFGDKPTSETKNHQKGPTPTWYGTLDYSNLDNGPITPDQRRADLERQKAAAEADRDSGQRWSWSWNREAEREKAQKEVDRIERLIAALEESAKAARENTAATNGNTTANGGGERPAPPPPTASLAN